MKYAKKLMMVPYIQSTGNLNNLDQKMNSIISSKLPPDQKVKLYNEALHDIMINIPDKPEKPEEPIVEVDNVPSKKALQIYDKKFLERKVRQALETVLRSNDAKRKERIVKKEADQAIAKATEIKNEWVDLKNDFMNMRKEDVKQQIKRNTKLPARETFRRSDYALRKTAQRTKYKPYTVPVKKASTDNAMELDLSINNKVGSGWIKNKNYF